jgi:hypothetical protein
MAVHYSQLPYKSVALALLFSLLFGPVGVLYASFWGGLIMIASGMIIISSLLWFPILLLWIIGCLISVRSVERHNQKMLQLIIAKE